MTHPEPVDFLLPRKQVEVCLIEYDLRRIALTTETLRYTLVS